MGHNIFLLDISHLTEMDMVSFIKGEIVLSDNMEIPSPNLWSSCLKTIFLFRRECLWYCFVCKESCMYGFL